MIFNVRKTEDRIFEFFSFLTVVLKRIKFDAFSLLRLIEFWQVVSTKVVFSMFLHDLYRIPRLVSKVKVVLSIIQISIKTSTYLFNWSVVDKHLVFNSS